MKKVLYAAVLWLSSAVPALATSLEELVPYFSGEYYTWQEHNEGVRLLKERGALVSAGITGVIVTDYSLTVKGKGEIFGGNIEYRGRTQAPDLTPISTDVIYFGTREEVDAGYRVRSGPYSLEPFAGLGYRYWLRDLQDTRTSSGSRVNGYTEWWQTGYYRLGARGSYRSSTGSKVFFEGGAKYPFYVGNTIDFSGHGTRTFRPRGRWSAFAETGVLFNQLRLAVFYEGFRCAESPMKTVGDRLYFQPDSSSDIVGLSVGWAIK